MLPIDFEDGDSPKDDQKVEQEQDLKISLKPSVLITGAHHSRELITVQ